MNKSYNYIEHLGNTANYDWTWIIGGSSIGRKIKYGANQLDGKQRHTGFDHYECDMPKFGTPGWTQSSLNRSNLSFQEHLEDLEHDQARHQGIHGYDQSELC